MPKNENPVSRPVPRYENGKQLALHVFLAALAKIDVGRAMRQKLRFSGGELAAGDVSFPIATPPCIIAFGKAAARMAAVLDEILGGEEGEGIVVSPVAPAHRIERFHYFEGGHPYPSQGSLAGAQAALKMVSGLAADDSVIFLISGGGSSLFESPLDAAVTLEDLVKFNRVLVNCGLPIEKINVLRKHISAVKGGRLGAAAHPARQVTLYISDVPAGFASMVASGPTMPDESTCEQCYRIAADAGLVGQLPPRIRKRFEEQSLGETPKPGDAQFSRSEYFCLLSNADAVEAAQLIAEDSGLHAEVEPGDWDADFRQVAGGALEALDHAIAEHPAQPLCLVGGGEVICPVTGRGVGGRNLSLALYAAQRIEGRKIVVLSGSTDGRDGNSPSCGAVADGRTVSRARALGLDPAAFLRGSDAYHFFRTLGDSIETGFTENNVRDLRLLISFE